MNLNQLIFATGLALTTVGFAQTDTKVSFEAAEGYKVGAQKRGDRLDWTNGNATVVSEVAPDGSAYLKFEGGSVSDLALLALDAPAGTAATDLRVFVRPPFTESTSDFDLVFFGGAIVGVAQQQDGQVRLSVPVDAQGVTWRDFTVARDPFTSNAPDEWTELVLHRDAAQGVWDISMGGRVIATGLPLATAAMDDDVLGVCGLGPIGVDAVSQKRATVSVALAPGTTARTGQAVRATARQKAADLVTRFDKARGAGGNAAATTSAVSLAATATPTTAIAPRSVRLELFLPKP